PTAPPSLPSLSLRDRTFVWGQRTYLMAVLNVTPDSFSDGGQFNSLETAVSQAHRLVAAGADILDIGGQSTRPGAVTVTEAEELARVIPVITALRSGWGDYEPLSLPISVDTTRASVAQAAIAAGADLINDISAGTFDDQMLATAAALQVPIVLMHLRGTPQTMQQLTDYRDLIGEITMFLTTQVAAAQVAGMPGSHLILDPGIGFAKTVEQNVHILRQLPQLRALGYPLLIGPSRKSFIGHLLNEPDPQQRDWGTAAACCAAIAGGADLIRIHDCQAMQAVCRVADAIWRR
ncbi:dihydropteroate synthase, partial [Trichothermofontia sp.]